MFLLLSRDTLRTGFCENGLPRKGLGGIFGKHSRFSAIRPTDLKYGEQCSMAHLFHGQCQGNSKTNDMYKIDAFGTELHGCRQSYFSPRWDRVSTSV
ncbi:hypothetical protein TNCV_889341 [Trichonephila clavipes]|nr:hypothetical protein TNCV_889341 [Trichonephila clavipes]